MPAFSTTAELGLEIVVTLQGGYTEADPSVGIFGATPEDIEIEDIHYESRPYIRATPEVPAHWGKTVYTSLLQGVDHKNPEVQKLLSNILDLLGDEACFEALKEANAE